MCSSEEEEEEEEAGEGSVWQREEARCAVVLHEVFQWLSAREASAAGGVCVAWRRAAGCPVLWRRLLQRDVPLSAREVRALARHHVCWREEYVRTFAGWEETGRVRSGGGSAVHAALDPVAPHERLALLTDDDVALTVWRYSSPSCSEWVAVWRSELRRHGWAGAARVQWAAAGRRRRLLVAGALALAHAWELIVIQLDEAGEGRVLSRARCSAGAAGCWADAAGEAFLSLELAALAPGVACTTVWLNSASQETQSEHAGVRAPLFRLYNDSGEHFTQAIVIETPAHDDEATLNTSMDLDFYLSAMKQGVEDDKEVKVRVLVTTSGCGRGGAGGGAASAWSLPARALRPATVCAAERGDLRARAARAAAAPPAPHEPLAPTESEVRALCAAPLAMCALPAAPVGAAPHRAGRCLWLMLSSGEPWCLSLPTLRPLRRLAPPAPDLHLSNYFLYYVQPSVSDTVFASPVPGAGVRVWSAVSGGVAPTAPITPLAPLQALLLPTGAGGALFVLSAGTVHNYRALRAATGTARVSTSCGGPERPPATACPPKARPACRPAPPTSARRAERVACCPPPRARRPPCPSPPFPDPLSCAHRLQGQSVRGTFPGGVCVEETGDRCGAGQDRVARRLAAAASSRRADYEREVRAGRAVRAECEDRAAPLSVGAERHCARASDGRVYSLPCAPEPLGACGPCREPLPPHTLHLQPDDNCRVTNQRYVDPCAHRPRTFVEIARGKVRSEGEPRPRGLASRIVDGLRRPRGPGCGGRTLHTAPVARAGGIDEVLRERAAFKEAGRGRVSVGACAGGASPAAGGQLELAVPPGAARVSVSVTLHAAPPPAAPAPPAPAPSRKATSCASIVSRRESWLSFESIQQKFTSKRPECGPAGAGGAGPGRPQPPCPARAPCPPPCPPPAPQPAPAPPKHPYPRHPCPPRPSCPPKTSQPSKENKCGCSSGSEEVDANYPPLGVVLYDPTIF